MMESYLLASLLGMGYLLHGKRADGNPQSRSPTQIGSEKKKKQKGRSLIPYRAGSARPPVSALGGKVSPVNKRDKPSMRTIYDSNRLLDVSREEQKAAERSFRNSRDPAKTGVIPLRYGGGSSFANPPSVEDVAMQQASGQQFVRSPLTDQLMPVEKFTHNNMVPFFGSTLRQNMSDNASKSKLEALTTGGVPTDVIGPKREREPLFEAVPDVGNQYGMPVHTDTFQERMPRPNARNNELPFQQERVGPGLNSYSAEPDEDDTYMKQRDLVKPRTVDDLRTASNPKTTYEGRMVESGLKGTKRGQFARMAKNRPETTVAMKDEDLVPTSAAVKKERRRPDVIEARETERQTTSTEYGGAAYAGGIGERQRAPRSRGPHRQPLAGLPYKPSTATTQGRGHKDDFGKGSILVYANERDLTSQRTHQGNVTSAVKAIVAPLQDIMRTSKKEELLEAAMKKPDPTLGGARPQIPSKPTVYDPNDVARTTVRQTTQAEVPMSNVKGGAFKLQVYDADDVARTTLRETTQTEVPMANVTGGAKKLRVHDPSDVARTTIKETTQAEAPMANVTGGAKKLRVHDPNDVMRTTIRQTTQAEAPMANVKGGAHKLQVYDADDVARTTIRQTTQAEVPMANVTGGAKKLRVHDPKDVARTTTKETTQAEVPMANVTGGAKKLRVHDPKDVARTTTKETTHFEGANFSTVRGPNEKGYTVDPDYFQARATGKETLTDKTQPDRNITGQTHLSELRNPDDRARTTGMETLVDHPRPEGNIGGLQGQVGGYEVADVEAPPTQKEVLSTQPHVGGAETLAGRGGGGYEIANTVAPDTQKQVLSDRDYYGSAGTQSARATMSYDSAYNAETNELRELTLQGRDPTPVSTNLPAGSESINLENTKRHLLPDDADQRISRNVSAVPVTPDVLDTIAEETEAGDQWRMQLGEVTHEPNMYNQATSDRLDPSLLSALDDNPLVIDSSQI